MRARLIISVVVVFALCYGAASVWRRVKANPESALEQAVEAVDAVEARATKGLLKEFEAERATTKHDLSGERRVAIENPFGHIVIAAGGPQMEVERVIYARGKDAAEAKRKAAGFKVTTKRTKESGFTIAVEGKEKEYDVGVSLTVRVPPTADVTAYVTDGAVQVGDLQGAVKVEASSGDIVVGKVKGKVTVSTSAGSIEVKGAGGGLDAQTSSGSLLVSNAQGPTVTARTMSGAIKLHVLQTEKLIATTMSGAIEASVAQPFSGSAEVRSATGAILLALPANSNCRVETATGSGAIKCSLPLRDEKHAGPNVTGRLGAGKGKVIVTNNTGAIEVKPTR